MQVLHAFYLACLIIMLIGAVITIYGNRKDELFCLLTGPSIISVGLIMLIWAAFAL